MHLLAIDFHIDTAFERLVNAMLTPGLSQRLKLHIPWLSAERLIMLLNSPHFHDIQKQIHPAAKLNQLLVVQITDSNLAQIQLIRRCMRTGRLLRIADYHIFDTVVSQYPFDYQIPLAFRNYAKEYIFSCGAYMFAFDPHIRNSCHHRFSHRVRYAAF